MGSVKTVGFSGRGSLQTLQKSTHILGNLFSLFCFIRFELCSHITC
jgi:hypothetical protein